MAISNHSFDALVQSCDNNGRLRKAGPSFRLGNSIYILK